MNKEIIEAVQHFSKLVELGSYSAVKESSNVQVNTLKIKIGLLESYLNLQLIKIENNRAVPTNEGMKFYYSYNQKLNALEQAIDDVKVNGFEQKESLKVLGTSMFLRVLIRRAIAQIQEVSDKIVNIYLDSYISDSLNGKQYNLDSYCIVQLYEKDLKYIDLDSWIICYSVDDLVVPAYFYGKKDFVNELHNNRDKLLNTKMVFHNYDFNIKNVYSEKDKEFYKLKQSNAVYIINTEAQKANVLKNDNVLGFMPEYYHDVLLKEDTDIEKVKGFYLQYPVKSHLILVNRNSPYKDKLVDIIRSGVKDLREKYTRYEL